MKLNQKLQNIHVSTLKGKVLGIAITTLIVVSILYTYRAVITGQEIIMKEIVKRAEVLTNIAADIGELPLISGNPIQLEKAIRTLQKVPEVAFVAFYDKDIKLLQQNNANMLEPHQLFDTSKVSIFEEKDYFDLYTPVFTLKPKEKVDILLETETDESVKELVGWVRIGFSKIFLRDAKRRIIVQGLVIALVFTTLCIYILVRMFSIATKPLTMLLDAVKSMSQGNYPEIAVSSTDEIGTLAAEFNEMSKVIHEREKLLDERYNELKKSEADLRDSEEKYRMLFESADDAIFILETKDDKIGQIIGANPTAIQMYGYTVAELMTMNFAELSIPETRKDINERLQKVLRGDKINEETTHRQKDNRMIPVESKIGLFKHNSHKYILVIVRDISNRRQAEEERKRLETQLAHAHKMEAIGILAGGVAHDLNNILSGTVSSADLILFDLPPDNPLRNDIVEIKKSGLRAAEVVEKLLYLAKRSINIAEIVNLNIIINDYLNSAEHKNLLSTYKHIQVETNLEKDLWNIAGSSTHLFNTIMNLVINAAEAMLDGGKICISSENTYIEKPAVDYVYTKAGEYVVLKISDTGIGIPPEDRKRIFEPFYTKKSHRKSGTGLGLAIVWGTVKDHKGYINVENNQVKGTIFTLYFPATKTRKDDVDTQLSPANILGHGESILVIDDIKEQRHLAMQILARLGYYPSTVSSGEEALEYLKNVEVDLVLIDMIMETGMDGLDTYKKIIEINPDQKAIIVSGFSESERVKEAQRLGIRTYIKKPYTLDKIGAAIKEELLI